MKKQLCSTFQKRQSMHAEDFEVHYYSDLHFRSVDVHAHNHYEIYLFVEGIVEMEIEDQRLTLNPGDTIILPPGVAHRAEIKSEEVPYRRYVCWLSKEYCSRLFQQAPNEHFLLQRVVTQHKYVYHFTVLAFNALQNKLFALLDAIHSARFAREAQIKICMADFLICLNRAAYEQEHPRVKRQNQSYYEAITGYIDAHIEEPLPLERLAREFYISKYYIAHLFQESVGMSIHQYIIKKRLAACCDAIRNGTAISKVYALCGFREYSSFYRAFKKEYGMSPSEYESLIKDTFRDELTDTHAEHTPAGSIPAKN